MKNTAADVDRWSGHDDDFLVEDKQIGRYFVLSRLGEGGMGTVYKAWDPQLDRPVALKVLRRGDRAASDTMREMRDSLMREAKTLAQLSHPNIVAVYDAGLGSSGVFIAMELCEGKTLGTWLREEEPGTREIIDAFIDAGTGLAVAHEAGIVHRDFKPANVLIGDDRTVRVADFGLAELVQIAAVDDLIDGLSKGDAQMVIAGTPMYMAPEQLQGHAIDHRTDQFTFCQCLWTALLSRSPFSGRSLEERRKTVPLGLSRNERVRLRQARHIPVRVRRALLRGLSVDPTERYPSMNALLADLAEPKHWPWLLSLGPLLVGIGLGAAVVMKAVEQEPCENPEQGLAGVWDEAQRSALEKSMLATQHPYASTAFDRASSEFDAYTEEWVDAYSNACHDTFVSREQSEAKFDLLMQCLQRRRNRLATSIEEMSAVENSQQMLDRVVLPYRLPSISECTEISLANQKHPLPTDTEVRGEIDAIGYAIDRANTLEEAGDHTMGLVLANEARDRAMLVDYPPVQAQALETLGRLQTRSASAREAESTLREAIKMTSVAGDPNLEARAWSSLLFTLIPQGKIGRSEDLNFAAEAAIARSDDPMARAWLLNSQGALLAESGREAEALEKFRESIALKEETLGPNHFDVGISFSNLAEALARDARWEDAEVAFERARTIIEGAVGAEHPLVYSANAGMCAVLKGQERYDEAAALCGKVLEYYAESPPSPMWESRVNFTMAEVLKNLGRIPEARQRAERARRAIAGEDPSEVAEISKWIDDLD